MKKIAAIIFGLGLACAANADIIAGDVIYVDFGEDFSGGFTNNISSSVADSLSIESAIRLSDGAATGVGIAVAKSGGAWTEANTLDGNALSLDPIAYGDALGINNGFGATMSITFTGLNDSLTYDLTGGVSSVPNYMTGWTIENQASPTYQLSDATASAGYISFAGLTSSSGELLITLDYNGLKHLAVSQLTLTSIPEPASLGLVAVFGVGILSMRRRLML